MVSFSSTFCPYNFWTILASSTFFDKEKKGRRVYIQQCLNTGEGRSAYLQTSQNPHSREPLWVCHPHGSFDQQLLTEVSPWNCKKLTFLSSGTAKTAFLHGSLRVITQGDLRLDMTLHLWQELHWISLRMCNDWSIAFSISSCFRLFCIEIKFF